MHDGIPAPSNARGRPFVVWTRAAADLTHDSPILNLHRVDIIHVPCIRIDVIAAGMTQLKDALAGSTSLVFTSQNAVKMISQAALSDPTLKAGLARVQRVLTHGRQTASTATEIFGGRVQCIDVASSADLSQALAQTLAIGSEPSKIVWPGGEDFAFDLADALRKSGHDARHIAVYRTAPGLTGDHGNPLSEQEIKDQAHLIARRAHDAKCVVCFASPSAVTGWLALASSEPDLQPRRLVAATIGPTTARAATAAGFGTIAVCAWPNLQDLISLGASCAESSH